MNPLVKLATILIASLHNLYICHDRAQKNISEATRQETSPVATTELSAVYIVKSITDKFDNSPR